MPVNEPVEARTQETIQIELNNNVTMISKVIAYTKAGDDDWVEAAGTADWSAVTEIVTAGLKKKKRWSLV